MKPLRVVIVDDEAPARAKLRRYLQDDPQAELVRGGRQWGAGRASHRGVRPDVVLLDVQMPVLDGFDVLEALQAKPLPHIIFVTAHDAHAVRAFEVRAVDYLLKPVDRERLAEALERVADLSEASPALSGVLEDRRAEAPMERFLVRERGRLLLVPLADVNWVGAAGNYVEVHTGSATHLVRGTLTELEDRLPTDRFARVHRSSIVNLDRIKELQPWSHGDLNIVLRDGTELRMSRRYRDRLGGTFGG